MLDLDYSGTPAWLVPSPLLACFLRPLSPAITPLKITAWEFLPSLCLWETWWRHLFLSLPFSFFLSLPSSTMVVRANPWWQYSVVLPITSKEGQTLNRHLAQSALFVGFRIIASQNHQGASFRCRFLAPTSDSLDQSLWGWGPTVCSLPSSPAAFLYIRIWNSWGRIIIPLPKVWIWSTWRPLSWAL